MHPEVGGELAVLVEVFRHPRLELVHFFGTLEQPRVDFTDSDEDHVAEFALEQLRDRNQRRQPETVVAADQDGCGRCIGIALGGFLFFDGVQFRQDVSLELLDSFRDALVVAPHNETHARSVRR